MLNLSSLSKPARLTIYAFSLVFGLSVIRKITGATDLTSVGTEIGRAHV